MNDREFIVLSKPWGGFPAGKRLAVLGRFDRVTADSVDPARAASLIASQRATRAGAVATVHGFEVEAFEDDGAPPVLEPEDTVPAPAAESEAAPTPPRRGRKARG